MTQYEPRSWEMPEPLLVVAGSYDQYLDWMRQGNHRFYRSVYVMSERDLRGRHAPVRVFYTGTYWENPVFHDPYLRTLDPART